MCWNCLLYTSCSAQPNRDAEEFQKDKDTVAQLDTALKKLEDAESFHLKQENDKGQLVDMSIRKSGSRQDTTAKPNDVYAPYEFSGTYTDEKGTAFHIEQTKQSGLMAEVNIADTRLLSLGFNTIRWDKPVSYTHLPYQKWWQEMREKKIKTSISS